jgi:glycosyltransferase involved in cell wall biosynthesis
MRILLMTQYFHPEPGAPANRTLSFARGLAKAGHRVSVICEFPCYPSGRLQKDDKYRMYRREPFENFTIYRSLVIPTSRSGLLSRLINYWSFMLSSFVVGLFLQKPDLILASSPPLFVAPSAVLLSILKGVPMVADIRDLWPEDAIMLGHLRNRIGIWGGRLTAWMFYKRAKLLITISPGMKEYLLKLAGNKEVFPITNGSSVPDMKLDEHNNDKKLENGRFTICYSGTLGLMQQVEDMIDAAVATRNDKDIKYLIVGEGVRLKELMARAQGLNLNNMLFTGGVSFLESLRLMKTADAGLVVLSDHEYFSSAIPSKFFDCMALGLPVILGVNGNAREILETNKTGFYYRPGDIRTLVQNIYYLKDNPDIAIACGRNGADLVQRYYRRSILVEKLEKLLRDRFGDNSD